jgi:predicted ester cyclase
LHKQHHQNRRKQRAGLVRHHRGHHALRARVPCGRIGDDRRALRPGLVDHNPAPGHEPTLAGFKQKIAGIKTSFPDLEYDLQDIIASGDTVATR